MKKLLTLAALLVLTAPMWAQSDSTFTTGVAQDDTSYYEDNQYRAPNRNPIYYFGSPFASHFVELQFMLGNSDLGAGLTYAYIPEVWGGHITGMTGLRSRWLMAGADYRLSKPWTKMDWHLYSSLGFRYGSNDKTFLSNADAAIVGYSPAMELGLRVGKIPSWGSFCLTSANLGVLTDFQNVYVTFGFSTSLALFASIFLLLGLS